MICGGLDVTAPTHLCCGARARTHSQSHCVPISLLHQFFKYILPLLLSSVMLHLLEWPLQYLPYSQGLFLNASQSNGLFCQKLLGMICFAPWKHGLQGCRFESQSTYERFPIRCIVLTKGPFYSARMRCNYIPFIWCTGNCWANQYFNGCAFGVGNRASIASTYTLFSSFSSE